MTGFAEAEGPQGGKTRTWLSVPGEEAFTCAGIWRDSDERGPVFSLVMTEACAHMDGIHDRMPVILAPRDQDRWTNGTVDEARDLGLPWMGGLAIDRTNDPWTARR